MVASSHVRIAVFGAGSIGMRHLATLHSIDIDAVAVPVRSTRRSEIERAGYASVRSLESAKEAGVVGAIIATETGRHAEDVKHALDLRMHVLCEKPLAPTAVEAMHLPALARSKGCKLFVGYCLRFDEGLIAFRSCLNEIGAVHSVRIECRSYLPDWRPGRDYRHSYSARAQDGGVLRDLSHDIDYALWLFGSAEAILGDLYNTGRLGIETEELAEAIWRTSTGTRVSIGLDYLSRTPARFIRASGSEGELTFDFVSGVLTLRKPGKEPAITSFPRNRDAVYEAQARAFLKALDSDGPTNLATAGEALKVLQLCDAWRRSSASGCAEQVAT